MRKSAVLCCLIGLLIADGASAETRVYFTNKSDVIVGWDHPGDEELAGFKLYHKATGNSGAPVAIEIPGASIRTYLWGNFPNGSRDLFMTAYDLYGNESDPSEIIQVKKRVAKPGATTTVQVTNPNFFMVIP